MTIEYKVVPAPRRGLKAKGVKTAEDRFAHALQTLMNELAAEGWEYLRTDALPSEQREGLMGKSTVYQNMLIFKRPKRVAETSPRAAVEMPHRDAPPRAAAEVAQRAAPPRAIPQERSDDDRISDLRELRALRTPRPNRDD